MTLAINKKDMILENLDSLTLDQQDAVLEFIEFLRYKAQKEEAEQSGKENPPMSAYEAAKEFAGCVDFRPGDLAINKDYLKKMGSK